MIKSGSGFLEKSLFSISWPIAGVRKKSHFIITDNNNFLVKLLHMISYSQHELIIKSKQKVKDPELEATMSKIGMLWDRVIKSMKANRLIIARNALRKIIEIDKFNAAAYNRLGIIHAKRQEYELSISNFKTAAKLENSASVNHNLGLVYYEIKDYKKALKYFKRSLKLDNEMAARYIAVAKVHERLGNNKQLIKNLEIAHNLEPSLITIRLLYSEYTKLNMTNELKRLENEMKNKVKKTEREIKDISQESDIPKLSSMDDISLGYFYN